jgi:serine/threonine protein kinase
VTAEQGLPHVAAICSQLNASLERDLGEGAFKHAYLVTINGHQVALKIAPVSENLRARFEREIVALRGCSHPAIASLLYAAPHAVGTTQYWVLYEEFLPGGTLDTLLANKRLSVQDVKQIGVVLADALEYLYTKRFVHRDIKPANILFRRPGEPVLTDFGIVRILGEKSLTHDFLLQGPGTPLYAAPEQLSNDKGAIDWRTDQFGLALVLARCLLQRHAFTPEGGTDRDAVVAVASHAALPTRSVQELRDIGFECLVRALQPWPVQRFRYPADFLTELSKVT